jgi:hypothetical protein
MNTILASIVHNSWREEILRLAVISTLREVLMSATKRFKLSLLGALLAGGMAAAPAQATLVDGIVDVWNVDVNAIFDTTSVVWQAGEDAGTVVNNQRLEWGSGTSGPSSLQIGNSPANVDITTNGPPGANISVTHANNPISSPSGELDSVKLISTLTLTPKVPPALGIPPQTLTYTILFDETPNADNPCIAGGANGVGVNLNGCADVFVIDFDSLNFPFFYDLDGPGGPLQNQQYFITFYELTSALNPLLPAACETAGSTSPCKGFLTPEDTTTTFQFAALITTEPVSIPEPGTLAALSVGLLALGVVRRRRRS